MRLTSLKLFDIHKEAAADMAEHGAKLSPRQLQAYRIFAERAATLGSVLALIESRNGRQHSVEKPKDDNPDQLPLPLEPAVAKPTPPFKPTNMPVEEKMSDEAGDVAFFD